MGRASLVLGAVLALCSPDSMEFDRAPDLYQEKTDHYHDLARIERVRLKRNRKNRKRKENQNEGK